MYTPVPMLDMQQNSNPFASYNPGQSSVNANQMGQGYQNTVSQYQGQMANQTANAGQSSSPGQYPTFANAYGVGSQQPFGQPVSPSTLAGNNSSESDTSGNSAAANRGFNPWSMVGEANAR